ncbi:MAG: FimB/Mfa2 family fimbrial subunit [Tannerellaceae bacterium]|nr:FimB/Mfa2 family fimbrial subunit [Tannerellaceae bacterium]
MKKRITYKMIAGICCCLFLFICSGCVYDELEECENETCKVTFNFAYEYHLYEGDRFADEINHIDLFIYDKDENLYTVYQTGRNNMGPGQTIEIELPVSLSYTAVAWANCNTGRYTYHAQENLQTLQLAFTDIDREGDIEYMAPGNIFHVKESFTALDKEQTVSMNLIKNTNIVRVRMIGLTEEDMVNAESLFYSRIESHNTRYLYDNTLGDSPNVQYKPRFYREEDDEFVEFQILRMHADDLETKVTLRSRDEGSRIAEFASAIIPKIQQDFTSSQEPGRSTPSPVSGMSFEEYLERCDEFELTYQVHYKEDADGNVIIELTPWEGIAQPGDL